MGPSQWFYYLRVELWSEEVRFSEQDTTLPLLTPPLFPPYPTAEVVVVATVSCQSFFLGC